MEIDRTLSTPAIGRRSGDGREGCGGCPAAFPKALKRLSGSPSGSIRWRATKNGIRVNEF